MSSQAQPPPPPEYTGPEPFAPLGAPDRTPAIIADDSTEKLVLGAILNDPDAFLQVGAVLTADDFSSEKHKRIFLRMGELHERGETIDRVTLANELNKHKQLQTVDGLSYLVSLDEGLPQIHNLESYARIVKETSNRRRIALIADDLKTRAYENYESSAELLAAAEQSLSGLSDAQPRKRLYLPYQIIEEYPGGANAFLDPSKQKLGLATGFIKFDEMTGGLRSGELFILAARPAVGKSSMATCIAANIAAHNDETKRKAVALFSFEMSKESILTRIICSEAHVDQQRFRAGYTNFDERQALQRALYKISQSPLYIDDSSDTNTFDIHSKIRRLQKEADIGLVIADYLQLMKAVGKHENIEQSISSISRAFKLMAGDLKVPFLVLSQLSRASEIRTGDHRPILSDLRNSGAIEQDADLVGFLFREELYRPDKESLKGVAELILAKQRNGNIGRIKLVFMGRYTRFENYAGDSEPENPYD